jgi:hypothetical protein
LALKFGLPGACVAAVTAVGIGKNEQLLAAMVAIRAVAFPPTSDGVRGKGGGVMRDTHKNRTSVGEQVIDTVRNRDANGIGTEVAIVDAHGRAIPLDAIVFEIADQFSFFVIDADDGKPLALEAGTDADGQCEFRYQPEGWGKAYRFLALRYHKQSPTTAAEGPEQYQLFDTPEYRYRVFVTNMTDAIYMLAWFYNQQRARRI